MTRTVLGRHIYAVGGNREAAHLSGVPVKRVLIIVYTICGALAGRGGVVNSSLHGACSAQTAFAAHSCTDSSRLTRREHTWARQPDVRKDACMLDPPLQASVLTSFSSCACASA